MRDAVRKEAARAKAEAYSPAPKDTRLMYAVVAISVMLIAVMGVAGFYSLNVWREPWLLVFFGAIATVTGLVTRRVAARRHRAAHQAEYDLTE